MQKVLMLSLAILFYGCSKVERAKLDEPFWVKYSESVKVEGIKLTFDAIKEDSRCPADVTCIQAGRFIARISVDGSKYSIGTESNVVTHSNYTIEFIKVSPETLLHSSPVNDEDYKIQLKVFK